MSIVGGRPAVCAGTNFCQHSFCCYYNISVWQSLRIRAVTDFCFLNLARFWWGNLAGARFASSSS